jgi:hypothetical protein
VPAAIKTLLKECLAKNRDHRPNSMVDVRRRLYEALRQKPAVVAARQPASEAAARFQTLLRHMQDTDDADSAAIRLTTEYARRLSVAITDLAESGVLHGQSKASIKTTAGGVFALTPGFRAPRIAGGALTLSVRTIDDRLYAMCESHVQVEIAEPPDRSVLVRWLPVVETSRQPETVRRFQLDQLLPQLSADLLETIDTAPILEPTMQLLLARAEARMIQTGYRVPAVVAPAAAMPVPTSQVGTIDRFPDLQPVARELLATILRQSHPRDNYHGFWGAGTFGGWHLILAARRGAPGGDRAIDELTGRFELSDLEELCANGYIRLEEQGPSEVRGTILAKAYAEYDKRPS